MNMQENFDAGWPANWATVAERAGDAATGLAVIGLAWTLVFATRVALDAEKQFPWKRKALDTTAVSVELPLPQNEYDAAAYMRYLTDRSRDLS